MAQLRRESDGYAKRDVNTYVVTNGTPKDTAAFCAEHGVPFTCLVDDEGEPAYQAFGLEKVGLRRLFGPSLIESLTVLAKRFREVSIPASGDPYQMSGTFVIDGQGVVRLAHRSRYPNDHVSSEQIWACLDTLAG